MTNSNLSHISNSKTAVGHDVEPRYHFSSVMSKYHKLSTILEVIKKNFFLNQGEYFI